ncbi:MAG: leucyl/phenylalanyl-tRNA--protein transferase [Cellvibrionales bacterium TMED148]|nr:leucyl/phenylalanyl-tRNA--protein transferase [Porticoccaceae bacterium]RPG94217.1 MAG: leucyl/phenylalanyl-tRNA--protein transferase [Cellvibrionales bacterium TMED148]
MPISYLDPINPVFPDPKSASFPLDGLLAVGGNLQPKTLISAYRQGIFPWYNEDDPLLWWSPPIRCVLHPQNIHISRSLKRDIRKNQFSITSDLVFNKVVRGCSEDRNRKIKGSWITLDMEKAYCKLHTAGAAHSVEVWLNDELIGGLYGVAIGGIFCGESMFSSVSNASKVALIALCEGLKTAGFSIIDCQLVTPHLESLGATSISRASFLDTLYIQRNRSIDWPDFNVSDICKKIHEGASRSYR